jgi:hypothetical protein
MLRATTAPTEQAESQELLLQLMDPANRADPDPLYAQFRDRGSGLPGRVRSPLPQLLEPSQSVRFLRVVVLQHHRIQMRHMDRLLGEVKRRGATTFEVTEEANARFLDRMTQLLVDSVFRGGNCATSRSYYFNHSGEATLLRPTSTRNAVAKPRPSRCTTTRSPSGVVELRRLGCVRLA